jgi:hypothetical protein
VHFCKFNDPLTLGKKCITTLFIVPLRYLTATAYMVGRKADRHFFPQCILCCSNYLGAVRNISNADPTGKKPEPYKVLVSKLDIAMNELKQICVPCDQVLKQSH